MRSTSPTTSATAAMLLIALLAIMALPANAIAGEVHFDPQSPAGKEYALPLPQARNEALGTGAAGDTPAAPLFGVGIGGPGGGAAAGAKSVGGGGGTRQPGGKVAEGQGRAGTAEPGQGNTNAGGTNVKDSTLVVAQSTGYDAGSAITLIAGLLLLSVLAGFALRLMPRPRSGAGAPSA